MTTVFVLAKAHWLTRSTSLKCIVLSLEITPFGHILVDRTVVQSLSSIHDA